MYFESIIKQCYRIKINCVLSVGAEKLNRNINLWNSSINKLVPIKIYSFLCYSKFGPLRKFRFSAFSIDKRLSVSLLAFSHRSERFRMWRIRQNGQQVGRPENSGHVQCGSKI